MSGICSAHQHHDPACPRCTALPVSGDQGVPLPDEAVAKAARAVHAGRCVHCLTDQECPARGEPSMNERELTELALTAAASDLIAQGADPVYAERDQLVAALSKCFPSHLALHDLSDTNWDSCWRNIVCVHLPTGQATWHIHERELPWFAHLGYDTAQCEGWDGHTTDEKYRRLADLLRQDGPAATGGGK